MRTVVSFEYQGQQTFLKIDAATVEIANMGDQLPVPLPAPAGTLVAYGQRLRQLLLAHPQVQEGLNAVLAAPTGTPPGPLYFRMVSPSADAMPWEQIYNDRSGSFCALDQRWPIGRIAKIRQKVAARAFVPPLRVTAVLSALGAEGKNQLDSLVAALSSPKAGKLDTHLHVISGEKAVLDGAAAHHGRLSGGTLEITFAPMPGTTPELAHSITSARPHLLHLLCHGEAAQAGERILGFATVGDFLAPEDEEPHPVRLALSHLVQALTPCGTWLVVLNACATANAVESRSLAHELVSKGIPAVAGMRRAVDIVSADRFCKALYPEVVAAVVTAAAPTGEPREIDWAAAFTSPRLVLAADDPETIDTWTDPVLYAQDEPLLVYRGSPRLSPAAYAELRGYLDFWREYEVGLDPDTTDPARLRQVRKRIAETEAQLPEEEPR